MKNKVLWSPSKKFIKSTNFNHFIQFLVDTQKISINTDLSAELQYKKLYDWSINSYKEFWSSILEFSKIKYYDQIDSVCDDINKMPGAKWFTGVELNFAENLLSYRTNDIAIHFYGESKVYRTLTFNELYEKVSKLVVLLSFSI